MSLLYMSNSWSLTLLIFNSNRWARSYSLCINIFLCLNLMLSNSALSLNDLILRDSLNLSNSSWCLLIISAFFWDSMFLTSMRVWECSLFVSWICFSSLSLTFFVVLTLLLFTNVLSINFIWLLFNDICDSNTPNLMKFFSALASLRSVLRVWIWSSKFFFFS